jgi:hypothetical protein
LHQILVEIIGNQDKSYIKGIVRIDLVDEEIIELIKMFFCEYGTKVQTKRIVKLLSKSLVSSKPNILLEWLAEWSKKMFWKIFDNEVKKE